MKNFDIFYVKKFGNASQLVIYLCYKTMARYSATNITEMSITTTIGESKVVLRPEIVDCIKADGILYGKVANAIGVRPGSLKGLLLKNHQKLTLPKSLQVLSEHLGKQYNDLLTEIQTAA